MKLSLLTIAILTLCPLVSCRPRTGGVRTVGGRTLGDGVRPRLISPTSLGDVTLQRPTFRWEIPAEFDGSSLELCRDRLCDTVIETVVTTETFARPTAPLPPRSVVFWRVHGRVGTATDPATSTTWLVHVPAADASSGADLSSNAHFDVNGDGFDDLAISNPTNVVGGRSGGGLVRVFLGGPMGIEANPSWEYAADSTTLFFGSTINGVGDIDGDGYGDLAAGVRNEQSDVNGSGTVYVFHGSESGLEARARTRVLGPSFMSSFEVVAGGGDLNNDGYADMVVGAPNARTMNGNGRSGSVSVFFGTALGLSPVAAQVLEGIEPSRSFGSFVSLAGDLNGDGFGDLVVHSPNLDFANLDALGAMNVYYGSARGFGTIPDRTLPSTGDGAGRPAASVTDVNGDGFHDLVVGIRSGSSGARHVGFVEVYFGGRQGIFPVASQSIEGVVAEEQLGFAVLGARDLNGDGFGDVLVSAFGTAPAGMEGAGEVRVFLGGAQGLVTTPNAVIAGEGTGDHFGSSMASLGDTNADGFADVVITGGVTSPRRTNINGIVTVYQGAAMGLNPMPTRRFLGQPGDTLGHSLAGIMGDGLLPSYRRCSGTL